MDGIYIFTGLIVHFIALFRRELLIQKESFRIILGITVVLFIVGLVLHFTDVRSHSASGALFCPLPSLLLFRLFRLWFIKRFKHEPQDTLFRWDAVPIPDRVFDFTYFVLTAFLGMLVIIGSQALTKAGW